MGATSHRGAPQLTVTAHRYLDQIAVSSRPSTVGKAEQSLRAVRRSSRRRASRRQSRSRQVGRVEIEAFKLALADIAPPKAAAIR